jgi:hypothetical protein
MDPRLILARRAVQRCVTVILVNDMSPPDGDFARPAPQIIEQSHDDPRRGAYEQLIRSKYAQVHGARLEQFMPHLLGCQDGLGQALTVLGYRSAAEGPLFLEQYLDLPIEHALRHEGAAAGPVATLRREQIVEVGNFASRDRAATAELVRRLPDLLARLGFQWLVFTGTPHVRALVASFGAPLLDLGPADASRLQGDTAHWGRYYEETPRVMAGWLGHCTRVAA